MLHTKFIAFANRDLDDAGAKGAPIQKEVTDKASDEAGAQSV